MLSSSDAPAFQQALAGIRIGVGSLPFDIEQLTPDNHDAMQRLLVDAGRDVALLMLGTRASELAARAAPSAAVISCMARSADAARGLPNAVAVPIDIPIDLQIAWLGKLLPAARTIGLLFDPAINLRRIESLAPALARAGYTPLLAPVTSPAMLPRALSRLPATAGALLAIPDPTVYTQQASKAILLFSFRNKIPLIGLTEAWVKAGALYALDWDYQELGAYCGALAARAVSGAHASPPEPPRVRVTVNLRTAEQFRVKWDPELVRNVDRTYE